MILPEDAEAWALYFSLFTYVSDSDLMRVNDWYLDILHACNPDVHYSDWYTQADGNWTTTWLGYVDLTTPGTYTLTALLTNEVPDPYDCFPLDDPSTPENEWVPGWGDDGPICLEYTVTVKSLAYTIQFQQNSERCPADPFPLTVAITNTGECLDTYSWQIEQSGDPFPVAINPSSGAVGLQPGESHTQTLDATIPCSAAGPFPASATLTLHAVNSLLQEQSSSVTITAKDPCGLDCMRMFSSYFELEACQNIVATPQHTPSSDGCSSPFGDNPAGCWDTSFSDACEHHNYCYDTCNTQGFTRKAICDGDFGQELLDICSNVPPGECHDNCIAWAIVYANAVQGSIGDDAYENAQVEACACCACP